MNDKIALLDLKRDRNEILICFYLKSLMVKLGVDDMSVSISSISDAIGSTERVTRLAISKLEKLEILTLEETNTNPRYKYSF